MINFVQRGSKTNYIKKNQNVLWGLKFVPLRFKRLLILQLVHKVKLNLKSRLFLANLTLVKQDCKFIFTLLTDYRITNLLNPRGTNFSPP